jgi:PAS domain S-box-containing protein
VWSPISVIDRLLCAARWRTVRTGTFGGDAVSQEVVLGVGLGLGAAIYLGLAVYVWFHRQAAGARGLVAILLANVVWSVCYALELTSRTIASAEAWSGLKYVGIVGFAPAFWAFVISYSGHRGPLRARTLIALSVEPTIVLVLLAVPGTRSLIHTFSSDSDGSFSGFPLAATGPLFWPHAIYSYLVLLTAMGLLVVRLFRIAKPYRRQAHGLILAVVVPLIGNFVFNVDPGLTMWIDPTPFLFSLSALVLVRGFFQLRLLDLAPVARSLVIEQMVDGVLVLDVHGRVIDANPAGSELLRQARGGVVGRYVTDLLPGVQDLLDRQHVSRSARGQIRLDADSETEAVDLSLSLTSLNDQAGAPSGRLLVIADVSEQVSTQRKLAELLDEQTRLAALLQTGLRPPALPKVTGLVIAARSLPGERGRNVGGDFYDVHPAAEGDWAFVLGDVSGKGVRAAVVTAMVRYSVRTLSAQGWTPRQVLEQLNTIMLEPDDPERFCTLVYGRITPLPWSTRQRLRSVVGRSNGIRLQMSLGGHPPPFVHRRGGGIAPLDLSGTALGLLPGIKVDEIAVDLMPGDLLVAFTDGVIEARRDEEQFGDARLAWAITSAVDRLSRIAHIGPAELVETVADEIVAAVTDYSQDRDDVAVLVMAAE